MWPNFKRALFSTWPGSSFETSVREAARTSQVSVPCRWRDMRPVVGSWVLCRRQYRSFDLENLPADRSKTSIERAAQPSGTKPEMVTLMAGMTKSAAMASISFSALDIFLVLGIPREQIRIILIILALRPTSGIPKGYYMCRRYFQTYTDVPRSHSRIAEVVDWCGAHRLQLNASKTDLLWYGSSAALQSLSSSEKNIVVGGDTIVPADVVRDLGVRLWAEHVCSHRQDHANMFLPHPASTTDSSLTRAWRHSKTRFRVRHLAAGLRQRCACWTPAVNDRTTAACAERCCSSGARSSTTRPCHCSTQLPLQHELSTNSAHWCTSRSLETPRHTLLMRQPMSDLDRLTYAFRVAAPRLWNELPPDIRKSSTLATFKKHLKTFFIL